jgi:hypothetical protein
MAITYAWPWLCLSLARAWLAIGNNASRSLGTPDPAEGTVGGSFIDVSLQSGNALEAESPPVVPAGFALALFSLEGALGHLPKWPGLSAHAERGTCPGLRDFCFPYSRHATSSLRVRSNRPYKKCGSNGNLRPPGRILLAFVPRGLPLSLNWHRSNGGPALPKNRAHRYMCEQSGIAVRNWLRAAAATLFLLTVLSALPSFAQISEDAAGQCAALTNSVRRVTCYDLLFKLRVTEQPETTGQGDGVTVRLGSEELSQLDAWIDAQPEPKPNRREGVRRLLDMALGYRMP